MKIAGKVEIRVNGDVVVRGRNMVVSAGLAWAAQRLAALPPAEMSHFAFGPSGVALSLAQIALQGAELFARVAVTTTVLASTITYSASFTYSGSSVAVREMGIFNAAAAGTMLARFLPQEFTIFDQDLIEIAWSLELV